MSRKMNRREFIVKGSSVVLGAGLAANAGPVFGRPAADAGSGRVVEVFGPGAVVADRDRRHRRSPGRCSGGGWRS